MNPIVKTFLLVVALMGAVILASLLYSRQVGSRSAEAPAVADSPEPSEVYVGIDLSDAVAAGLRAFDEGRFDEARERLRTIDPSDRGYLIALNRLGQSEARLGNYAAAADSLRTLTSIEADNPSLLDEYGWYAYRADRPEEAEAAVLRAIEIAPDRASYRYRLGLYRLARGLDALAVSTYHRAMEREVSPELLGQADALVRELMGRKPELAGGHYVLAFLARTGRDGSGEIAELEAYLATGPSGPIADNARKRLAEARAAAPAP